MSAKIYRATTLGEAMAAVKRDLGPEAMVLKTRTVRRGGLLGFGGRRVVEILAAGEAVGAAPRSLGRYAPQAGQAARGGGSFAQAGPAGEADVVGQLSQLSKMGATLVADRGGGRPVYPDRMERFYSLLVSRDVEGDLAAQIVRQLDEHVPAGQEQDGETIDVLRDMLVARIRTESGTMAAADGRPCVVMLIGPTGVGKTTTVAKLAARYKLGHHRRVAMVTLDTYRIAAVDQLKTYADIIGLPLRTARSPEQLRQQLAELGDQDVVLIDSAGRSQHNADQLARLGQFVCAAQADHTYLVMAATADAPVRRSVVERFAPLGATGLILTKLDEAAGYGIVLNISSTCGLALGYITTGQEVPDDLDVADSLALAERIIGGSHGR